jgi:hypothetical protein
MTCVQQEIIAKIKDIKKIQFLPELLNVVVECLTFYFALRRSRVQISARRQANLTEFFVGFISPARQIKTSQPSNHLDNQRQLTL